MEKNYYDILQINKNASPEIIEKAYKVLAKKYHPDLQTEENKKQAEEILKKINEAYEILSNPEKKKNYDDSLLEEERSAFEGTKTSDISDSNLNLEKELFLKQQQDLLYQQKMQQEKLRQEQVYQEQLQHARQKAYHDAYIQDLKSRGYKIRYKKTFKDYLKGFETIILSIFILFLICQIPFVKNFLINFYESNEMIQYIVKIFLNIFQ